MAKTIDEQFVEYIVKELVEHPEDVSIERTEDEMGVLLKLTVHAEDLGRVIGKRGGTAQSLRTLLRALGSKNDARYNLKIVDVDRPEGEEKPAAEQPAETQAEEVVEDVEISLAADVEKPSELAEKTRKDLEELDDLDI